MGGLSVATDATAGERERQSLEPLLLLPVPRAVLVLGKLSAVLAFSALSLLETTVGFGLVPLALPLEALGFQIRLDPLVLGQVLLLMAPLLLLVAAFMLAVATRARTFKAAQSLLSVLMLIPAAPGIVLALVPVKLHAWMLLVPAFGEQLLVTRLIRGEAIGAQAMATAMASTTCWAALAIWLAVRFFADEKLLFGRAA
jgi:sodium transport system permease protein